MRSVSGEDEACAAECADDIDGHLCAGASTAAHRPPTRLRAAQDQPGGPRRQPHTAGKIALGKQLFFDPRLSKTKKMSCETCHLPEKGWTDGLKLSPKFDGSMNVRHTPTLYGVAYYPDLYWDGRAKGLEAQILAAWKGQMGADPDAIARDVAAVPGYAAAFTKEMGGEPSGDRIVKALAIRAHHPRPATRPTTVRPPRRATPALPARGSPCSRKWGSASGSSHLAAHALGQAFHNVGTRFDSRCFRPRRGKILPTPPPRPARPRRPRRRRCRVRSRRPRCEGSRYPVPTSTTAARPISWRRRWTP
jgi:cytochrome c peroxidase